MTQEEKVVEELVEETTQQPTEQKETVVNKEEKQEVKRDYVEKTEDGTIKLDLNKLKNFQKNAVQKQSTDEIPLRDEPESSEEIQVKNNEKTNEEITGETKKEVES